MEYAQTRHNAGLMLVDKLAALLPSDYGWRRQKDKQVYESENFILVKSHSIFMNESGRLVREYKDREIWLAHDELDLMLGSYKIQLGKGPKQHNGVLSVENTLGTREFWRIRIGIENRGIGETMGYKGSGEEYVLQRFSKDERKILDNVLNAIAETIVTK